MANNSGVGDIVSVPLQRRPRLTWQLFTVGVKNLTYTAKI